ncbi:MAG: hypothetical protein OXI87_24745 [Albidovulum sp.]|nr:hypothetical protein [Albidovulum sp.]MDE0533851.1 hypothetical protein [Albidovulum sp.]
MSSAQEARLEIRNLGKIIERAQLGGARPVTAAPPVASNDPRIAGVLQNQPTASRLAVEKLAPKSIGIPLLPDIFGQRCRQKRAGRCTSRETLSAHALGDSSE